MTPESFDQRLRQELASRQVLSGLTQTAHPAPVVANAALDALLQRRELQIQRFDPASLRDKVKASDQQIEAYYKAHQQEFAAPEQATIQYVVLDLAALGKGVQISEADERRFYAENASRYTTPEERRASHILVKAEAGIPAPERAKARAKAEDLLAQVRKAPQSFARSGPQELR